MADKEEKGRFVLLGRPRKQDAWDLIFIVEKRSLGWRTGKMIEESEHRMGNRQFECILVTEEAYDRGPLCPLQPPDDFDFTLPVETYTSIVGVGTVIRRNEEIPARRSPQTDEVEEDSPPEEEFQEGVDFE